MVQTLKAEHPSQIAALPILKHMIEMAPKEKTRVSNHEGKNVDVHICNTWYLFRRMEDLRSIGPLEIEVNVRIVNQISNTTDGQYSKK